MAKKKTVEILKVEKGNLEGQFRFVLKAGNGEIIAQSWSESYTRKASLKKTLKRHFSDFEIIDKTI